MILRQSPLFSNIQTGEAVYDDVDRATYKGITVKTCILLGGLYWPYQGY